MREVLEKVPRKRWETVGSGSNEEWMRIQIPLPIETWTTQTVRIRTILLHPVLCTLI